MRRNRFAITLAVIAAAASAAWLLPRNQSVASAATLRPTPGQLTILGKDGKESGLCPLKHTSVSVDISGYVARVTVQQEFSNPSTTPIEAVYTFPLPADAAVDDMTMLIGKRVVRGQIMRREEARQVYEEAKAAGKATALLDQERPNIFTQSVANIMPGERVSITISYVNLLKYEDGRYEFSFPMVVGPRYTPQGGYTAPGQRGDKSPVTKVEGDPGATSVVTDADKITPPITPPGTRAGHDISLSVNLDAGIPLTSVNSVLHQVSVQRPGPTRAVIKLKDENEIPNKDFILRYTAAGSDIEEGMLVHAPRSGGPGYFTLILQPPLSPAQSQISPKQMVFVIDQTGSQSGWPIQKSKETMKLCLKNLNPDDTFQLVGFNTAVYPCFPGPVPATQENMDKALAYLDHLEANGGTDILKAADYALKIPEDAGRLRIVCFMTDGYVGNDMQIIDFVKKNRGSARFFPFGIGNSVNRFLLDGMAREGRGAVEYVTLNTPGEGPAAKFYHRIASPVLVDVSVDWGDLPVEDVLPEQLPDLFSAGPLILKGRYTAAAEGDITVHGILRGQPWSRTVHVVLPPLRKEGSAIATLWARERIEQLQGQDWLGAQTGTPKGDIKEAIINTAIEYRLMSQYTSFVAVEERVVNVGGKSRKVDVPVEMPEGVSYEGIFGTEVAGRTLARGRAAAAKAPASSYGGLGGGYGGFGANRPMTPAPAGPAGPQGMPAARTSTLSSSLAESPAISGSNFDLTTEAGQKRLAALKPEERRSLLRETKLAPALKALAEGKKAPSVKLTGGRVEVQVWIASLPKDGLAKLKAAGFALSAQLRPGKLLLGTIAPAKLDALIDLGFVRWVELPKFR